MAKLTFNMVLAFPKVFNKEGKPGDLDRGDAKSQKAWLRALAKNPVAVVDAYFTSEADVQELIEHENFENVVVNPQTGEESTRIKEGNSEYGIGKYIKLKRKMNDEIEFVDRKTGDVKVVDKGGVPSVKMLKVEGGKIVDNKPYNYEELGPIGNGSEAKVRFELYGKGATRLEAIGVTKLVQYEQVDGSTQEDF